MNFGSANAQTEINVTVTMSGLQIDATLFQPGASCAAAKRLYNKNFGKAVRGLIRQSRYSYRLVNRRPSAPLQLFVRYTCFEGVHNGKHFFVFRPAVYMSLPGAYRMKIIHHVKHFYGNPKSKAAQVLREKGVTILMPSKAQAQKDFRFFRLRFLSILDNPSRMTARRPAPSPTPAPAPVQPKPSSQVKPEVKIKPKPNRERTQALLKIFVSKPHFTFGIAAQFSGDLMNFNRRSFFAKAQLAFGFSRLRLSTEFGFGSSDTLGRTHSFFAPTLQYKALDEEAGGRIDLWIGLGYMLMRRGHYGALAAETERHMFLMNAQLFIRMGSVYSQPTHGFVIGVHAGIGQLTSDIYFKQVTFIIGTSLGYQIFFG